MSRGGSRSDSDDRAGLVCAAVAGVVLGLVIYPPLVVGGLSGLAVGAALSGRRAHGESLLGIRRRLAAGAFGLVCLAVIAEVSGISQRAEFLERWRAGGVAHLGFAALIEYPWAWLVSSAAIASVVAAIGVWRHS